MKPATAVIAEDEPLLRAELRETLTALWPELVIAAEAEDGFAAMQALQTHQPQLLFLDIEHVVHGDDTQHVSVGVGYGECNEIVFFEQLENFFADVALRLLFDSFEIDARHDDQLDLVAAAGSLEAGHIVKIVGRDLHGHDIASLERHAALRGQGFTVEQIAAGLSFVTASHTARCVAAALRQKRHRAWRGRTIGAHDAIAPDLCTIAARVITQCVSVDTQRRGALQRFDRRVERVAHTDVHA